MPATPARRRAPPTRRWRCRAAADGAGAARRRRRRGGGGGGGSGGRRRRPTTTTRDVVGAAVADRARSSCSRWCSIGVIAGAGAVRRRRRRRQQDDHHRRRRTTTSTTRPRPSTTTAATTTAPRRPRRRPRRTADDHHRRRPPRPTTATTDDAPPTTSHRRHARSRHTRSVDCGRWSRADPDDPPVAAGGVAAPTELAEQIRYHRERYYRDDEPEISDAEFDALVRELAGARGASTPSSHDGDSPLAEVGRAAVGDVRAGAARSCRCSRSTTRSTATSSPPGTRASSG